MSCCHLINCKTTEHISSSFVTDSIEGSSLHIEDGLQCSNSSVCRALWADGLPAFRVASKNSMAKELQLLGEGLH